MCRVRGVLSGKSLIPSLRQPSQEKQLLLGGLHPQSLQGWCLSTSNDDSDDTKMKCIGRIDKIRISVPLVVLGYSFRSRVNVPRQSSVSSSSRYIVFVRVLPRQSSLSSNILGYSFRSSFTSTAFVLGYIFLYFWFEGMGEEETRGRSGNSSSPEEADADAHVRFLPLDSVEYQPLHPESTYNDRERRKPTSRKQNVIWTTTPLH